MDFTGACRPKALARFLIPLIAAELFQQVYGLINTAVVSRALDDTALAVMGACGGLLAIRGRVLAGMFYGFGICLGTAFKQALGDCRGICRYGSTTLPMDEALILSAVDISGRGMLRYHLDLPTEKVGTFDTELGEEFWLAFTRCAGMTLHLRQLDGTNSHHILEGAFKSVARSLRTAVAVDPAARDEIPSTKGVL